MFRPRQGREVSEFKLRESVVATSSLATPSIPPDLATHNHRPIIRRYSELAYWSLRENSLLIGLTIAYCGIALFIRHIYGLQVSPFADLLIANVGFIAILAVSLFCSFTIWFFYLKRVKRHPEFNQIILWQARHNYLTAPRLFLALPVLLMWPFFLNTFSYLKVLISTFRPFYLDARLADWDRHLHLGSLPSEWLDPVFGHVIPVFILNWIYTVWFLVIMTALLLQSANAGNRQLRAQYLLAQALLWPILGNLIATLLSSAGPCYYGLLVDGPNPYAGHMARLHELADSLKFSVFGHDLQIPITALQMQQYLWNGYQHPQLSIGQGISAFPSLHVASSWLIARLCLAYGRRMAFFGFTFLALIFIGSIELGWHYAIDGYLGAFGAWLCWRAAGGILSLRAIKRLLWGVSTDDGALESSSRREGDVAG